MILPGQAIRSSSLQYHEAAEVRQMPSLPFVADLDQPIISDKSPIRRS
jgi:hypothetical protein